ncbi:uncharacterized protein N7498_003993 [Penicillium cinerascens]|uniref:F-box domain-containing protein n=1 Tax=Penicillium cinerascens TaxID=70096 RepID=A0A9W9N362_9EURO|nr:uncharacterized protein N7498_003993 [Penicillium cinerascens]KAJ5212347.1 hypothetical protein N7498_003993 [Penicillium cinerascens]
MKTVASYNEYPSEHELHGHRQQIDEILHDTPWTDIIQSSCRIDKLPNEILDLILYHLSAHDLTRLASTCRKFTEHTAKDILWAKLVNSHLPHHISDPGSFDSFRRLYLAHLSYWFIPQYKIWFSDHNHTGNLILARYDNRRGVIDAYRIIADKGATAFHFWESHPEVMIQAFNPEVSLWLDDPVLLLKDRDPSARVAPCQTWMAERRMSMPAEAQHLFNSLILCPNGTEPIDNTESLDDTEATGGTDAGLWPPQLIPTNNRISRVTQPLKLPEHASEVSEAGFRIRRWAHFRFGLQAGLASDNEAIFSYATLAPCLYTPTKEKPYQGIWVGDYSAHGCEFLLIFQQDPARTDLEEGEDEHNLTSQDVVQKGSLRAVKLTGDPNVPRGELSFSADDIGPGGLICVADSQPFTGARIVRSKGHVAGLGFRDDSFIDSQLILISTDCLAHYWAEMGHVSYYRRVDIDALLQI